MGNNNDKQLLPPKIVICLRNWMRYFSWFVVSLFHWNLLISQVGPVHPVAHVHINSLTCGWIIGDNADAALTLLLNKMLFASLVARTLTGLPIELMPRIPRRTTTAVVCSGIVLSPSLSSWFWANATEIYAYRPKYRTHTLRDVVGYGKKFRRK